jgi:hypothetical protein
MTIVHHLKLNIHENFRMAVGEPSERSSLCKSGVYKDCISDIFSSFLFKCTPTIFVRGKKGTF